MGILVNESYLFSITAVTNCYKLTYLKQHEGIILQFCKSEGQYVSHWANIKGSTGLHSFLKEALGGGCISLPLQLLKDTSIPGLLHPFLKPTILYPSDHFSIAT